MTRRRTRSTSVTVSRAQYEDIQAIAEWCAAHHTSVITTERATAWATALVLEAGYDRTQPQHITMDGSDLTVPPPAGLVDITKTITLDGTELAPIINHRHRMRAEQTAPTQAGEVAPGSFVTVAGKVTVRMVVGPAPSGRTLLCTGDGGIQYVDRDTPVYVVASPLEAAQLGLWFFRKNC